MGATSKTGKMPVNPDMPDFNEDYKMGRTKPKRVYSAAQAAKRAKRELAYANRGLLAHTETNMTHGPAIGCKTGATGAMTAKQRREAITNLCGPSANAGNGPKQGIHNHTHKLNRERKLGLDAAWRKEYAEAQAQA